MESKDKNYEKDIDHIINEYKTQLESIKTKTSLTKSQNLNENSIKPITNKELTVEIQNDNLKLQAELALCKSQIKNLNSIISNQKIEIDKLSVEISSLETEMKNKEKENEDKIIKLNEKQQIKIEEIKKNHDDNITDSSKEKDSLNSKLSDNVKIINKFFDFFNNNISLFTKAQILSLGDAAKISYENNNNEKNVSSTDFSIKTMEHFINKLMDDNTEMYNQLMKYKELAENNSSINSMTEQNIKDVKYENVLLKQQINSLIEKLSQKEKENESLIEEATERKSMMSKTTKKKMFKKRSGSIHSSINMNNNNNMPMINNAMPKVEIEPIKKLKLKIKNLEEKMKNSDMNNE